MAQGLTAEALGVGSGVLPIGSSFACHRSLSEKPLNLPSAPEIRSLSVSGLLKRVTAVIVSMTSLSSRPGGPALPAQSRPAVVVIQDLSSPWGVAAGKQAEGIREPIGQIEECLFRRGTERPVARKEGVYLMLVEQQLGNAAGI